MKRPIRLTFFTKNLISAFLSTFIIGVTLTVCAVMIQKQLMTDNLYEQAKGVSAMTLNQLELADIVDAAADSNPESSQLKRLTDSLTSVSDANKNVAQVYLFSADYTEGKQKIIAMPQHLVEAGLIPGEYYENPAELQKALNKAVETKLAAETVIYKDAYGEWITIIEPIIDEEGKTVAVLGMDMNAGMVSENQRQILTSSLLVLLIALTVVMLLQFILTKRMLAPVKELFGAIEKVSQGQLHIELKTERRDDFGDLNRKFSAMAQELRGMIGGVQQKAEQAAASSLELADSVRHNRELHEQSSVIIREVAAGAQSQDQAAGESARVMEEMARGIQNIAETAYSVSGSAGQMTDEALSGQRSIRQVVEQMVAIDSAVNRSAEMIHTLDERSKEISSMVGAISDIAARTNLIALNAAIEAARAGEHGRGFAVVATEVRTLASQSADTALLISGVIAQIQDETKRAVRLMEDGIKEIQEGSQLTNEMSEGFIRMMEMIQSVSAQIEDMSAITEQMSASSEEVSASVQELASIARTAAVGAGDITKGASRQLVQLDSVTQSAERLNDMSKQLNQLVDKFAV